jgi:uncharacterized membrane protein YphA (DoxX/SURF4 family)
MSLETRLLVGKQGIIAPWATRARRQRSILLIRLLVGLVFFEEGVQKFFPALMGAGRFSRIGIPWPTIMGPFVGAVEIVCGPRLSLASGLAWLQCHC